MATIINNPAPTSSDTGSNFGSLALIVMILVIGILFFVYGLPLLRGASRAPTVQIPSQIDVDVDIPNMGNQGENDSGINPEGGY